MKKFLTIIGALLLLSAPLQAQDGEYAVFAPISKYIASGDASSLSRWFADHLDVTIISSSRNCSQAQARQILKTFFDSYTPRSFDITHKASEANKKYVIGNLNAGGEIFLVTIYATATSGETYKIQQLAISRQTGYF
jgi:hypothetical protein